MKDHYWFEHDSHAHTDPKILDLRMQHGWSGYGAFWCLIELLRDSDGYSIELNRLGAICFNLRIERDWVDTMFAIGLLSKDDERFWSNTLRNRMKKWDMAKQQKIDAGRKGGAAKAALKQRSSTAKAAPGKKASGARAEGWRCSSNNRTVQDSTGQDNKNPPLGDTRKRAIQIPNDWKPNDKHKELASKHSVDWYEEEKCFRDHAITKGRTCKDWDAAFRMWLRKAKSFQPNGRRVQQTKAEEIRQRSIDALLKYKKEHGGDA